jgi:hypothetical protein
MATTPRSSAPADETPQHAADNTEGKLFVLTSALVARTDAKTNATKRYTRGQEFHPVEGVHNVDALIAGLHIGRKEGDEPLRATTALHAAKAAAEVNQEDSPVLDLEFRPFERSQTPEDDSVETA